MHYNLICILLIKSIYKNFEAFKHSVFISYSFYLWYTSKVVFWTNYFPSHLFIFILLFMLYFSLINIFFTLKFSFRTLCLFYLMFFDFLYNFYHSQDEKLLSTVKEWFFNLLSLIQYCHEYIVIYSCDSKSHLHLTAFLNQKLNHINVF